HPAADARALRVRHQRVRPVARLRARQAHEFPRLGVVDRNIQTRMRKGRRHMRVISLRRPGGSAACALLALALPGPLVSACRSSASVSGGAGSDTRANEVIFQMASGLVENPKLANPFLPDSRNDTGLKSTAMEPLFLLNVENGQTSPWLA